MFLTTRVTLSIFRAELKRYLLTYLPGCETSWGKTSRGQSDKGAKRP